MVTLTATPGTNVVFAGWSGACSGTGACTVTMDAAKAVTATFEPTPRALDVAVTGGGSVTSAPAGISCPTACAASFGHGTDVTLTATPSPGSSLVGWGGACSGFAATCTVSMTAARSVTAEFTPLKHMLTVSLAGGASGSVTGSAPGLVCPTSCTAMVDHGTAVTLTPAAAPGAVFAGWSGACSGTGACTVTVDADRTATARFEPARQRLSVAFNGNGRVTSKPAGLDCRARLLAPARLRRHHHAHARGRPRLALPRLARRVRGGEERVHALDDAGALDDRRLRPRRRRHAGAGGRPAVHRDGVGEARQGAAPLGRGGRAPGRCARLRPASGVPSRRLASAAARATSSPSRSTPSSSRRYSGTQMLIAATGRACGADDRRPDAADVGRYAPRLMA